MPRKPEINPELSRHENDASHTGADGAPVNGVHSPASGDTPLSFVPHDENGQAVSAPVRIRTNRYGELEEHELIRLLDTIEDERARSRFRESIYISLFIWMAVVWVLFYGPKYLWHSPVLISPTEALQRQEVIRLNAPRLPHRAAVAPPKIDRATIAKLRAMEPKPAPAKIRPAPAQPAPAPVATQPVPANPAPALPVPAAPKPLPRTPQPVPDAPAPQAPTKPSFDNSNSAREQLRQAMRGSATAGSGAGVAIQGGTRQGAGLGQGVDILSDTQGVNFTPYLQRILREIYEQWIPLIPEEAQPPLSKQGSTLVRFTINPDGTIAAMHLDGSTHDDALNRAAWGSITGVGQFPPLPKEFHGPNLELRIHYLVNEPTQ
jgi:TonB family protein